MLNWYIKDFCGGGKMEQNMYSGLEATREPGAFAEP